MTEPIRVMGHSALQYIEAMCNPNWVHHDLYDYWPDFLDYVQNNFKDFIEDVLDDYLDRHLPEIFGVARYRIRFEVQAHVPSIDWRHSRYQLVSTNVEEASYSFETIRISVRSDHFRQFIIDWAVPDFGDIYNPGSMKDWIYRIGDFLLEHIHRDRNRGTGGYILPQEYAERLRQAAYRQETPEQKEYRERQKELARIASQKAQELLFEHLDKKQRVDYLRTQSFIVKGQSGTRYRIRKASQINVDVLDRKNKVKYKLCTVPDMNNSGLPIEDQLLAQKTLIELDEQQFLSIAKEW